MPPPELPPPAPAPLIPANVDATAQGSPRSPLGARASSSNSSTSSSSSNQEANDTDALEGKLTEPDTPGTRGSRDLPEPPAPEEPGNILLPIGWSPPAASLDSGGHIPQMPELPIPTPRPLIPSAARPSIGFVAVDGYYENEGDEEEET